MRLIEYFTAVAAKRLRAVEVDAATSNQHEFDGINLIRKVLGTERRSFETTFIYLSDDREPILSKGRVTWYDTRENQEHRSPEYRLYYPSTEVSQHFSLNDLMIVAKRADDSLLIIISPFGSIIGDQLIWMFGLQEPTTGLVCRDSSQIDRDVNYLVRWILESIGIDVPVERVDTDLIIKKFGFDMPTTRVFSAFAREQAEECQPQVDPDQAIFTWMETEEKYFRAFERILVEQRLREGFIHIDNHVDVDGFIDFSLSVQNRRKSRAGYAFENHLEFIFQKCNIRYVRGKTTEGKSKPDFLFPDQQAYACSTFDASKLAILGAKASCKERWRQILGEADRVSTKHLLTLEPSISVNQTDEMQTRNVQLVLPKVVHASYSQTQQVWLWSLMQFIEYIRELQIDG